MNNWMTYTAFAIYFLILIYIGIHFYFKSKKIEDYLLGGRGMGSWVTALSAQASDMSGWLLMGLPGAIYLAGLNKMWIAVGLIVGTFLNWYYVAAFQVGAVQILTPANRNGGPHRAARFF